MKIYVSKELLEIKMQLREKGYEIIEEDSESVCDAIICNLKMGGLKNLNMMKNIKSEGTLIIDSGKKTVEELENIISNKVYNGLF